MKAFILTIVIFFLGFISGYNLCENYYEPFLQEANERIDSVWVDILECKKKLYE